jgi:nucleoid-associated protein YgaU
MSKLSSLFNQNRFAVISWAVTVALVALMIGGALKWKQTSSVQALAPIPTAAPDEHRPNVKLPPLVRPEAFKFIEREIQIKTNIPIDKPRYTLEEYRVARGDSVFAIAESFKLKPETILWANYDVLQDSPDSLRPGQVLKIPPTDGIYYLCM